MYIMFLALWIIFNGNLTWEILIFGLVISAVLYAFICFFMDFSFRKDLILVRKSIYIIPFIIVLLIEIAKANWDTIKLLLSSKYEIDPVVVKIRAPLKTKTGRVLLANAITLTPGTITVALEEDVFTVHCLDRDFGEGIENSVFVKLLQKMEA